MSSLTLVSFTHYGFARSMTGASVSMLHLIVRLVLFWAIELTLTAGIRYNRAFKPGFSLLRTQGSTTEPSHYLSPALVEIEPRALPPVT